MSTSELEPQRRAWLAWEWRAALITIVGGIVVACAIADYFTFRKPSVPPGLTAGQVEAAALAQVVCRQAMAGAKAYGIVPNYAQLASPYPSTTRVRGRYECVGGTNVARYNIDVDLVCKQVNQQRCVLLYSVTDRKSI